MTLVEVEVARSQYDIPVTRLCSRAEVAPTTYKRWQNYIHGRPKASKPTPVLMSAVRRALHEIIASKLEEQERNERALRDCAA